jgi:hypothetical protein
MDKENSFKGVWRRVPLSVAADISSVVAPAQDVPALYETVVEIEFDPTTGTA